MGLCRYTEGKVTGVNPGTEGHHLERVPSKGGWPHFFPQLFILTLTKGTDTLDLKNNQLEF